MVCLVPLINKDPLHHFTHSMKVGQVNLFFSVHFFLKMKKLHFVRNSIRLFVYLSNVQSFGSKSKISALILKLLNKNNKFLLRIINYCAKSQLFSQKPKFDFKTFDTIYFIHKHENAL